MATEAPFNEYLHLNGVWDDAVLSYSGAVLGGLSLDGIDPTVLDEKEYTRLTYLIRSLFKSMPDEMTLTEIYIHYDRQQVSIKDRANARSQKLSKGRESFLNKKNLNGSRIYWFIEIPPTVDMNKFFSMGFMRALFNATADKDARASLKNMFSKQGAWTAEQKELDKQVATLNNTIDDLKAKLDLVDMKATKLKPSDTWHIMKALVNMDASYITGEHTEEVPIQDWDITLPSGDISSVRVKGTNMLKASGVETTYGRMASVTAFGTASVPHGLFGRGTADTKIVQQVGTYAIVKRFKQYSPFKRTIMFQNKSNELARQQIRFSDMMQGNNVSDRIDDQMKSNDRVKKLQAELDQAHESSDSWGEVSAYILVFDANPDVVNETSKNLYSKLTAENKLSIVWETAGLISMFPRMLIGYPGDSIRDIQFNTTQTAATSLIYRNSDGIEKWGDDNEESMLILETVDGKPFHFTPFIGDKFLQIGVGPTRSGKTYAKQIISSHFMKFGALYHGIDIDAGSEKTAKFFQDEAGIFRVDNSTGMNPFIFADGEKDLGFIAHLIRHIKHMLTMNDSEELQSLTSSEQYELDDAIRMVLSSDNPELKNLVTVYEHCSENLKKKLNRFVKGGVYSGILDRKVDSIGSMDKPFSIYNLSAIKENEGIFKLVQNEVFYRITKVFENPENLSKVKYMDIDECQYFFQIPGSADLVAAKARTWFKHNGGIGLWTQSPKHYMSIDEWSTLRASATTFWFMADPQMTEEEYKQAFLLTSGECETIRNLIPRKQAFIKQPEAGIATVVNISAEPEADVIATSRPSEVALINRVFDNNPETPIDEIIAICVNEISLLRANTGKAR